MNARLESLITESKKDWDARQASGKIQINVCLDTSSIAQGAEETLAALRLTIAA
jgi:hypothetical protein